VSPENLLNRMKRAATRTTFLKVNSMLVLSRKLSEEIIIGDNIRVVVIEARGDKVRLGIDAPRNMPVHRKEVAYAIAREQKPE